MPREYTERYNDTFHQIFESMSRDMMIRFQASKVGDSSSEACMGLTPSICAQVYIVASLGSRDQWSSLRRRAVDERVRRGTLRTHWQQLGLENLESSMNANVQHTSSSTVWRRRTGSAVEGSNGAATKTDSSKWVLFFSRRLDNFRKAFSIEWSILLYQKSPVRPARCNCRTDLSLRASSRVR